MAKILIVDDDKTVLTILSGILQASGHQTVTTTDGRKTAGLMRAESPDLLITDIFMPDQEGLETIRQTRSSGAEIPIIAISGGDPVVGDFLEESLIFGAGKALKKPVDPTQLLSAVDELLKT